MTVKYSIVVPVYNGSETLEELTSGLSEMFHQIGTTFEIIFVDDFSTDNSWTVLEKLADKDKRIIAIRLADNFGQHNATVCGLEYSCGEFVVTMDDDLQHSPEDVRRLIREMAETGADAVIAKLKAKKHAFYRRAASDFIRKLAGVLINKPRGLHLSSLRLIKRGIVDKMLTFNHPRPYVPALIFRVTDNVVNVEIHHNERKYGTSTYNILRMTRLAGQLAANSRLFDNFLTGSKPAYLVDRVLNGGI